MRPMIAGDASIPSVPLLRFLKEQTQEAFFTPCPIAFASRQGPASSFSLRPTERTRCRPSWPCKANVQSSLVNLDFLAPRAASRTLQGCKRALVDQCRSKIILRSSKGRHASTASDSLLRKLLGGASRKGKGSIRPSDLPPLPSFLDDVACSGHGRSKTGKAGNELKLRCTEIDENGSVTLVNGEFKKSELIAKYGLLPRDLRKIDSSRLPHILVRPSAILINLLHLRVLIKHDRVLVLDAYGSTDSYTQSQFMYDLSGKLGQKESSRQAGGLPYEFRALEAVLISVTTGLESEFDGVSGPVVRVLRELEEDIDRDKLRHLLIYSKKLGTFEQKARLVRDAIDDLLEADDDLVTMYLTERANGKAREEDDHTEVEMLLESYHKVCDEIVQESGNLVSNIRNTEEIVKAILDANRNSLMLLDLKFSIGTLGIGSGAFIASLYGMNLKNFIEESDLGFLGVTGWSFVLSAVVCYFGLKKLRKVQRVSMWGEKEGSSRGSWRSVKNITGVTPGEGGLAERERVERIRKAKDLKIDTLKDPKTAERREPLPLPIRGRRQ